MVTPREKLREWMDGNNVRHCWTQEVMQPSTNSLLKCYVWRHGVFLVHEYGEDGFEVYKPCPHVDIDETLTWLDEV